MKGLNSIKMFKVVVLLFMMILLSGCTITQISSYDEVTDKAISSLQRKVESFLIKLETKDGLPECTYKENSKFYSEAKVDLSAIKVRAQAIPKNEITIEQIQLLDNSLNDLETLHKYKDKKSQKENKLYCISKDEVAPLRIGFNSSFTAILKLELAKKRGEE
jgi:hypothetical protein